MDTNNGNAVDQRRLLRRKQVLELVGVSNTTLHRLVNEGALPRPVAIGSKCIAWWSDELNAALNALPRSQVRSPNPKARRPA